jgi:hypothetical protein
MTVATLPCPKYISGETDDAQKNPYHTRELNGTHVLVQRNRHGIWHGYVACIWKGAFTHEAAAIEWLVKYPMADVPGS